ncbi:hypothetical protein MBLNU459_g4734t1 [Dothideomycetes sp. NU459]
MARNIFENDFRKLRLDTRATPFNIPSSPFASISHENVSLTAIHSPALERHPSDLGPRNSALSSSDLLDAGFADFAEEGGPVRDAMRESMISHESTGSARSQTPAIDVQSQDARPRNASISFSSHATLDNGMRYSLEEPLPKPTRRHTRGESLTSNSQPDAAFLQTPGSQASPRVNPFTGEPARRRPRRSEASRLSRIDPVQGDDSNNASLTSGSTMNDEMDVPDTPSNSFLLSPRAETVASPAVSPIMLGEPWPMVRNSMANSMAGSMTKSRISSRIGSLRDTSRRSSRLMSGSTSMSPATAFLSQWGQDSIASMAPDPDDEGQPLGLNNEYVIGRQLGFGGFSVVKELVSMSDGGGKSRKAVKIVRKVLGTPEAENDKHQQEIEHEVGIWRYLQHDNILPLHAVFDTDFATFCVMDLVEGGTLFDIVRDGRSSGRKGLGEKLAKLYAFQLASALRYLHEDMRVVHRDVKLENCLVDFSGRGNDEVGLLKLCDFGLADFINNDMSESMQSIQSDGSGSESSAEIVGTLQYAAPENLSATKPLLQPQSDIWAFGVCLYALITGDLPFNHSLHSKVVDMISSGNWDEKALVKATGNDHESVKELMYGCLSLDPDYRWTISDIMRCSWLEDVQDLSELVDDWQILTKTNTARPQY